MYRTARVAMTAGVFCLAVTVRPALGGRAEVTPDSSGTNLVNCIFDDAAMTEVIRAFCRMSSVNILSNPQNLQGRVTAHLTKVEWRPALESILEMNGLRLVQQMPGADVYSVVRRPLGEPEPLKAYLLFGHTEAPVEPRLVSLHLTNASIGTVLREIAPQARINIVFNPSLDSVGSITVGLDEADTEGLLFQLASIYRLQYHRTEHPDCYVLEGGYHHAVPYVPSHDSPPEAPVPAGVVATVVFSIIAFILLIQTLRRSIRKDLAAVLANSPRARLKVRTFWMTLFALAVFYGLHFGTFVAWTVRSLDDPTTGFGVAILVGIIFALLFFWIAVAAIRVCRTYGWVPKGRRLAAAWVAALLPFVAIVIDLPPIFHDYTWQDLPVPKNNAQESYALVQKLITSHGSATSPDIPYLDPEQILTNAPAELGVVQNLWDRFEKERQIITKLNSFDAIADLTDESSLNLDDPGPSYMLLHNMARLYRMYAAMKTAQGKSDEGVVPLVELQSVARKAMPCSRVGKMIWSAIVQQNIQAAYYVSCSPNATTNTLRMLQESFVPLAREEISLRQPFVANYLSMKGVCRDEVAKKGLLRLFEYFHVGEIVCDSSTPSGEFCWPPKYKPNLWRDGLSRAVTILFFRKNRTIRDFRQYYDLLLDAAERRPQDMKRVEEHMRLYASRPRLANLGGWALVGICMQGFDCLVDDMSRTKILSDLFAMHIDHRLGGDLVLNDYYTGQPYRVDVESNTFAGAGKDKKHKTKDDISLSNGKITIPDL